jgi:alpha-methylacyl-CoA racemase
MGNHVPSGAGVSKAGPLAGYTVVELAGKGPVPFAAMLLADMGADVIRVERTGRGAALSRREVGFEVLARNRRSIGLDLKLARGRELARQLIARADALIEGYRPGVMERLGLGPDECLARNPRLVYARVTGWGREGPLAARAGHDINYLALSGALHAIGPRDGAPVPPLNLLADFGAGGMFAAFGIACGLLEAAASGQGQVVDVAMLDGLASLLHAIHGLRRTGEWTERRGVNLLDGGAPFYTTYETRDGRHVVVGPIEPEFHAEWIARLGLPPQGAGIEGDARHWPEQRERIQAIFRQRTLAQWCEVFAHGDACVTPVLTLGEAVAHEQHRERQTYVEFDGWPQAAPAPRFSRTPGSLRTAPCIPGEDTAEILRQLDVADDEIADLMARGVVSSADSERRQACNCRVAT